MDRDAFVLLEGMSADVWVVCVDEGVLEGLV